MRVEFRSHALRRMEERTIRESEVKLVVREPREVISVKFGRLATFNYVHGRALVVIYERRNDIIEIVTAMWSDERRLREYGFSRV